MSLKFRKVSRRSLRSGWGNSVRLKRNDLKYLGQAVMKLQPEYAVMENVPEVMSPKYKQIKLIHTFCNSPVAGISYSVTCSRAGLSEREATENVSFCSPRASEPLFLRIFNLSTPKQTYISTAQACVGRLRRNERGPAQTAARRHVFLVVSR